MCGDVLDESKSRTQFTLQDPMGIPAPDGTREEVMSQVLCKEF